MSNTIKKINKKYLFLLFIVPALIMNFIFFLVPLIQAFGMSFFDWPVLGETTFIGFENYINLFQDRQFWSSVWFTIIYILLVTPSIFIVAFLLALLVNKKIKGMTIFRSIYFTPVVISMVSSSLMWLWIFNDLYGVLNYYLVNLNIISSPINWMGQASTSLPAITFMITWKMAGFTMVILLAGLQGIPEEVYEASHIDGATKLQQVQYITIPLLRSSIVLSLIVSILGSALAFDQFLIMTRGGPSESTMSVVHRIYNTSFRYFDLGYGASMTILLLIVLILLSIFQFKFLKNPLE